MKTDILGVTFDNLTMNQALERARGYLQAEGFHYVVTPNPEFVLAAQKDPAFSAVLNGADLTIADGIGVVYAAKILATPLHERVPGIDFASGILAQLNDTGGRVFLLGAKPGVAQQAGERIQDQYPGLTVCGTHHGYFKSDEDAQVARLVADTQPDALFVCLGAPRQELWMAQWGKHTAAKLAIGLGGALDVFAGTVQRAPERFQKLGLEWAYRLVKEPKRITRMAKLPLILVQAAWVRLKGGRR